jgi:hypothetical protein
MGGIAVFPGRSALIFQLTPESAAARPCRIAIAGMQE